MNLAEPPDRYVGRPRTSLKPGSPRPHTMPATGTPLYRSPPPPQPLSPPHTRPQSQEPVSQKAMDEEGMDEYGLWPSRGGRLAAVEPSKRGWTRDADQTLSFLRQHTTTLNPDCLQCQGGSLVHSTVGKEHQCAVGRMLQSYELSHDGMLPHVSPKTRLPRGGGLSSTEPW